MTTANGATSSSPTNGFRNWTSSEPNARFAPEKDRYHLYAAYGCPFAHRTLMTRSLKGLQDVIGVTIVHPTWQKTRPDQDDHTGWVFANPDGPPVTNSEGRGGPFPAAFSGNEVDPLYHAKSIRELYERANASAPFSVPVLWDKKENTMVNNESLEIARMLNAKFNAFAKNPDLDLYPADLQTAIDEVSAWVTPNFSLAVYKCGFATSQAAYDEGIVQVTEAFDKIEKILSEQRYLTGDRFTEADVRLFASLLRFDEVYTVYFKVNTRSVARSHVLLNYCRDVYQMPGIKETVNMEQIKTGYYSSKPNLNYYSIIPRGNNFVELLEQPHDRATVGWSNNKKEEL